MQTALDAMTNSWNPSAADGAEPASIAVGPPSYAPRASRRPAGCGRAVAQSAIPNLRWRTGRTTSDRGARSVAGHAVIIRQAEPIEVPQPKVVENENVVPPPEPAEPAPADKSQGNNPATKPAATIDTNGGAALATESNPSAEISCHRRRWTGTWRDKPRRSTEQE